MSTLALMMLAYQLVLNPTPQLEKQYESLNETEKTVVREYIQNRDELPKAIEQKINESKNTSGKPEILIHPTWETAGAPE